MTSPEHLNESLCWKVSGVRKATDFFGAVALLVPDATHLFLEGTPDSDVEALLVEEAGDAAYAAPGGTIWSWPRRNRQFAVRVSSELFVRLCEAAAHHAEPEICDHLHLYRGQEALVQWFDAFSDPLLISKSVPRERVERFAAAVGGVLSEGAA